MDTLELIDLDLLVLGEQGCEMPHHDPYSVIPECSGSVTHRYSSDCGDRWSGNVCQNVADYVLDCMAMDDLCEECDRRIRDCWSLVAA